MMETLTHAVSVLYAKHYWVLEVALILGVTLYLYLTHLYFHKKIQAKGVFKNLFVRDVLIKALKRPLSLLIIVIGVSYALTVSLSHIDYKSLQSYLPQIQRAASVALFFYFWMSFIHNFEAFYLNKAKTHNKSIDKTLVHALSQVAVIISVVITALIIMQLFGIPISGLIAFGGIGGAGVAFAAKDLLANFFGSLVLYVDKPFKVGDWISSPDKKIEGAVEHIGMRVTKIRTVEKRMLYVPNGLFLTIIVENASRMTHRRLNAVLGLRYDDADKLEPIINDIETLIMSHEKVDTSLTTTVNLTELAASSLNVTIAAYIKEKTKKEFQAVRQSLFIEMMKIIDKHGAECAFPTQTVHVPNAINVTS